MKLFRCIVLHIMLACYGIGLVYGQAAPVCELDKLLSTCICHTNFGMLDLTMVASKTGPRFSDIPLATGEQISYNPCLSFSEGTCTNAAVCLTSKNGSAVSIGSQESAQFISNADQATIYLTYSALGGDNVLRSSRVLLTCNPDLNPGQLTVHGEISPNVWDMNLESMFACAQWYPPPINDKRGSTINPTDKDQSVDIFVEEEYEADFSNMVALILRNNLNYRYCFLMSLILLLAVIFLMYLRGHMIRQRLSLVSLEKIENPKCLQVIVDEDKKPLID